ncbi:MAG TPA: DUF6458 family protein [Actinomycetota bacterium]|nr:DUF6458 family protein [Actinomycetota bacterium]
MGIGASLFLIALGAILAFAVSFDAEGFDINTIGIILLIVGVLGGVLSMIFWSSWGGWGNRRDTVVHTDRVREREVV